MVRHTTSKVVFISLQLYLICLLYTSYTKEDVYRWMKNDLAYVGKEKSIIVFNHSLPEDTVAFKYGISDTEYIDLPAMGLKAWLYGHWHVNHVHKHKAAGVYTCLLYTSRCV